MDIPFKSKPKVSIADHLEASLFANNKQPKSLRSNIARVPTSPELSEATKERGTLEPTNYKLTRTYSETETNNFDADTGHRLFDDGKIRTKPSRIPSPVRPDYYDQPSSRSSLQQLYVRSHETAMDLDAATFAGLEDEYIPGLDFASLASQWNRPSSDLSTPVSRDALFLDLNLLHAKVAPQPIQYRNPQFSKSLAFTLAPDSAEDPQKKKHKASPKDIDVSSFEAVLASLPSNFNEFPYSQRKKLVKQVSETIDYSQFSQFAKSYFSEKLSGNQSAKSFRSDPASFGRNGSFLRRSRRNSANTVAGRLLALSLSLDLKKLEKTIKHNVDEKGAYVLDHQLGKVIGFGAWGIIRECVSKNGTLRAVKIVKSTKELDRSSKLHNPKVLQIFRKEIAIWQQLNHPNILPLLDSLETDDVIFCLTNRITGGTLFDLVTRWGIFNEGIENTHGPVTFSLDCQTKRMQTTIEFVRQIVDTLLYMHEDLGIVHGDLKLENVLVDDLNPADIRMILCDFGMSRVYTTRLKKDILRIDDSSAMARSKSSFASIRRPYNGPDSVNTRDLFADDCKIGVLHLFRSHGPSINSVLLAEQDSHSSSLANFHEFKSKDNKLSETDSDLPHLHIGSLPYAAPELLEPQPPPLGPSADIWALGVLIFTMAVGKLPFQHPYEPRLRAMITAGKYNKLDMMHACLMEWLLKDEPKKAGSMVDMNRVSEIEKLKKDWEELDHERFAWFNDLVCGCLQKDITRRLDLVSIAGELAEHEPCNT